MALHVREPFAYDDPNGVTRVFRPGDLVADDDPAYEGREHLFETADENVARRLPAGIEEAQRQPIATAEDASSEPGRRRVLSRAKDKDEKPAKPAPAAKSAASKPAADKPDKAAGA